MMTAKVLLVLLSLTNQVRSIETDLDHAEATSTTRTIIVEPAEVCIVAEDPNGCE